MPRSLNMRLNFLHLLNPYGFAVMLRNSLYDRKVFKACKLSIPVISVGNLCVGGTGKSSLVRYIAEHFSGKFHVCILSRGYKRKSKGTLLVSCRGDIKAKWEEAGDEAFMLAKTLRDVSVVVDENRCRGSSYAINKLGAELIILDDGFQHRKMHRDLDLLLIREKDLKDHLLPFGRLREPLSSIVRADAIILSYQDIKEWDIEVPKPVFKLYRKDWNVRDIWGNPLKGAENFEFIAFAGIGDNEQFFKTLERMRLKILKKLSFRDHYHYKNFKLSPNQLYITTLKDIVKLPPYENIYYLDYSVDVPGLLDFVEGAIIKFDRAGSSAGRATDS
jgi:tetraacyldisaccharide 4'-kinase